jgi:hypothetical protein
LDFELILRPAKADWAGLKFFALGPPGQFFFLVSMLGNIISDLGYRLGNRDQRTVAMRSPRAQAWIETYCR